MGKMSEEQLNDEQETRRVTVLKYILNNCNDDLFINYVYEFFGFGEEE